MKLSTWDAVFSEEESLYFLESLRPFFETDITRGLSPSELVELDIPYTSSIDETIRVRQLLGLYQKYEPLPLGIDKESVAFSKFLASEVGCKRVNEHFRALASGYHNYREIPGVASIIHRAQRKIASVLGAVPPLSALKVRLGPGATTNVKRNEASVTHKLGSRLACSESSVGWVDHLLGEMPMLSILHESNGAVPVDIHHGKLQFVPKSAKTYRSIVVEPILNSMVQLGIDGYMRSRLLRHGIDLRDQSLNQRLARLGSLTGDLATLDLSSASDSIATELVAHLLPVDWFCFLQNWRSSTVSFKGEVIRLEKFSSMGNGFTFPLESLIFYALSWACCDSGEIVSVYGDDIIVPTHRYAQVVSILNYCGFSVNMKKSFVNGPFRESCGRDYLSGIDVRPLYFKDRISCADVFRAYNFFKLRFDTDVCDHLLSFLDPSVILWGPVGFGDGHLVGDWTGRSIRRNDGWAGFVFDSYSPLTNLDMKLRPGDSILPVYSIYARNGDTGNPDALSYNESASALRVVSGKPRASLPGVRGYKRISIYTFDRPTFIM